MPWFVEHTDLFGGEFNYCWVNRHIVPDPVFTDAGSEQRMVSRAIKNAAGKQGVKGTTTFGGDYWEWKSDGGGEGITAIWIDDADADETNDAYTNVIDHRPSLIE